MPTHFDLRALSAILVSVALPAGGCQRAADTRPPADTSVAKRDTARADVATEARAVLAALEARDGKRLAARVHPGGVRFSPYPHVSDSDVVLAPSEVAKAFSDTTTRLWGYADGSGAPLNLTFDRYYARYVSDLDFSGAPVVKLNEGPAHGGNTPNNIAEVYRGAQWVEFHFPSIDPKYDGMDWRSLWLVFARSGDAWRLVGIVHGAWTI